MERRSVVIGGGGLTAATAVGTLRERGFNGRIALVAVERHEPYIRPPLSKGYLAGRDGLDEVFVHPSSWYTDNVGAVPAVARAAGIGLPTANGIEVGGAMATSVPGVFAADDVADAYLPAIERRLRSEHWANAIAGGRVAARGMLGERVSYNEILYFYIDQYDRGMEYSGYAPLTQGAEVVYRGDPDTQECLAFWPRGGWVVAGISLNVWDVNDQVQRIIRTGKRVDSASLADVAIPLSAM
jgi:3-phenylpropionate/trans-cinnamate dioxygenase ferredoxin reductase subunit